MFDNAAVASCTSTKHATNASVGRAPRANQQAASFGVVDACGEVPEAVSRGISVDSGVIHGLTSLSRH